MNNQIQTKTKSRPYSKNIYPMTIFNLGGDRGFMVTSESRLGLYHSITKTKDGHYLCDCESFRYGSKNFNYENKEKYCKHLGLAVAKGYIPPV